MPTKIEWVRNPDGTKGETWNPITGCSKISPGCKNCYAERMAKRLQAMGNPKYANGFKVTMHPEVLEQPLKWKKPRMIFVNSMSDTFHDDVPLEFIEQMFDVMRRARWHTFQVLTKRASNMVNFVHDNRRLFAWPTNVWTGVTVEDNTDCGKYGLLYRIRCLQKVPATIRFLSLEPLLSSFPDLDLRGITWCIVGCETGPGARPMELDWVRDIRDQCQDAGVPLFFKQAKIDGKIVKLPELDGRQWMEFPEKGER